MHTRAELAAPVVGEDLFRCVDDLSAYPAWLSIIREVRVCEEPHTWSVLLEARVGPFRRGKLLRMTRTVHEHGAGRSVARFERRELDGRDHAAWTLEAVVTEGADDATLTMDLTYGGRLWAAPVEAVLAAVIESARPRLIACATEAEPTAG